MGGLSLIPHLISYLSTYLCQDGLMDIYFILWIIVQYDFIKLFQLWPLGALLVVSYVL